MMSDTGEQVVTERRVGKLILANTVALLLSLLVVLILKAMGWRALAGREVVGAAGLSVFIFVASMLSDYLEDPRPSRVRTVVSATVKAVLSGGVFYGLLR